MEFSFRSSFLVFKETDLTVIDAYKGSEQQIENM